MYISKKRKVLYVTVRAPHYRTYSDRSYLAHYARVQNIPHGSDFIYKETMPAV